MATGQNTTSAESESKRQTTLRPTGASTNADDESDYTSSSGSSSGEEDDENDEQDEEEQTSSRQASIPTVRTVPARLEPASGLKSRLAAFLPQIERSNRELESSGEADARRIDDVDENDEHYIEMNLGLGVLVEQQPGDEDVRYKDDSEDESSSTNNRHGEGGQKESGQTAWGTLAARPIPTSKTKIEEL